MEVNRDRARRTVPIYIETGLIFVEALHIVQALREIAEDSDGAREVVGKVEVEVDFAVVEGISKAVNSAGYSWTFQSSSIKP